MGVADRDWYSDRRPPGGPGWPPRRGGWNPVVVAIAIAALFLIGTKVDRWLSEKAAAKRQSGQQERVRVLIPPSDAPGRHQAEAVQPQSYPAAPARAETSRTITRCIVDGRVFYVEDGRCTLPQASAGVADGAYGNVSGLTAYQREMLRSADARIARDAAAARADMQARQQAHVSNRGECAALDEAIRGLDSAARQPLSGYQQDSIRRQRQDLTSRKFALRC